MEVYVIGAGKTVEETQNVNLDLLMLRLRSDKAFGESQAQYKIFAYLFELSRRQEKATEYGIALDVLGKGDDFNAIEDSVVRANISRLRKNISLYNAKMAKENGFEISFPKRSYEIEIIPYVEEKVDADQKNRLPLLWLVLLSVVSILVVGFTVIVNSKSNQTSDTATYTETVFPKVHVFLDQDALTTADQADGKVVVQYLESLLTATDLINYTSKERSDYNIGISYAPDQVFIQIFDRQGKIIRTKNFARPQVYDYDHFKALARAITETIIQSIWYYHAKNPLIKPDFRREFTCLFDLWVYIRRPNVDALIGDYGNVEDLMDCPNIDSLQTPAEKSTAYSLLAFLYFGDYTKGTKLTGAADPLLSAKEAFAQAKSHDSNLPIYLRQKLMFIRASPDRDMREMEIILLNLDQYSDDKLVALYLAATHGYYYNDWPRTQRLFKKIFGEQPYQPIVNGQTRKKTSAETLNMMAFIMAENYDMAYKALEYRKPTLSYRKLTIEVLLYCLTGDAEGLKNLPDGFPGTREKYRNAIKIQNYHPKVEEKFLSITEGEVCNVFEYN